MIFKNNKSAAAALLCGGMVLSASAAHAQRNSGNEPVLRPLAFKVGVYIPYKSNVRKFTSNAIFPMLEAEYTLQNLLGRNAVTTLGVAYAEHDKFRFFPITLSEVHHDPGNISGNDYYYGGGLGLYPTRFDVVGGANHSKTLFGIHAVIGLNLKGGGVFAEVKYHLINRYNDYDISGFQVAAGLRF